jgi:hypothetical protein
VGQVSDLVFGCASALLAAGLAGYGWAFLRKLRHISYF